MENERKTMTRKRAARSSGYYSRAYASISRDADILAEFERATKWAGIIIALAFGICLFVGLM